MTDFKGKNGLTAREFYMYRSKYRNHAYAIGPEYWRSPNLIPAGTIDFWWAERGFYGRVSTNGISETIEPFTPYLKTLKTKKSTVFAMNFVVDAFKSFQQAFLLALKQGKGPTDDPMLSEITATKGYVSVSELHKESQETLLEQFTKHLLENDIINNILNMEDFLNELIYYIMNTKTAPFTRSGFIMSNLCNPRMSGLCVEIKDFPYSEDEKKIEFINSPNFYLYRQIASEYGFAIDKNIPWRLVAFLGSDKMLSSAKEYKSEATGVDDIINMFYLQSAINELETMKLQILKMYNQFVRENPTSIKMTHSLSTSTMKIDTRSTATLEKLNSSYNDCKWLELYIKVRNLETGLNYPEPAERAIIRVAKDIQKTLDTKEAMGYIKIKFSGVEFYEGSLDHETERNRQANSEKEEMTTDQVAKAKARSIRKIFF